MATKYAMRDYDAIQTELDYRAARSNYYKYCLLSNDGFIPSRLHHLICTTVDNFMNKKDGSKAYDVLLISMPPQHGKSLSITETLPSWWLGLHPDQDAIIISYSDDTASRFGRANRSKLERFSKSPYDVVSPLFPNYEPGEVWNNTDICNTKGKFLRSRGIRGGITANPAHLIVIDDPIKTMEEAQSETSREGVWSEYLASVRTRIKPGGKLIVIATRWTEDDLIGRLLAVLSLSPNRLTTLFLPCECTDPAHDPLGRQLGDALCPEIGRGNEWLTEFKAEYLSKEGQYVWSALYQCDPSPIAGAIVKPEWWRYYDFEDNLEFIETYISVDAAFKGEATNDYVVIQVWSVIEDRYYLRTQERDQMPFTVMLDRIRELIDIYPGYASILIEDKANGSAAIDVLSKEYDNIIPVAPAGGKVARLHACSHTIRQGRVFLPRSGLFTKSYINEFTSFPNGKFDDQVDATTQVLNHLLYVVAQKPIDKDKNSAKIRIREWTSDMYEDYYGADEDGRQRLINQWGYPKYGFYEEDTP